MMMYGIFIVPLITLFMGLFLCWASGNYNKFNPNDVSNEILKITDPVVYKEVPRIHGINMILLSISLCIINIIEILFIRTKGIQTGFPGDVGAITILIQIVGASLVSSFSKYLSNKKFNKKQ